MKPVQPGAIERIKIVGAGVIGLSTACVLAEAGYEIAIVAEKPPEATTSAVAAAFWEPFHAEGNEAAQWAEISYRHFLGLRDCDDAGITITAVHRLFGNAAERSKWESSNSWHGSIPEVHYRQLPPKAIPNDFSEGVAYDVPVVHMPSYLNYLRLRFLRRGSPEKFQYRTVGALANELDDVDALVNCTGMGSRIISDVRDLSLERYRGQIVVIPPMHQVGHLTFITTGEEYEDYPIYVVPRGNHDIVLGGTYILQQDDNVTANESDSQRIIRRAIADYPALRHVDWSKKDVKVGLRPVRKAGARVQSDTRSFSKPVIHNYGHGGAGVTLSWGCAESVLTHIESPEIGVPI